jgi:hypothetical protein
MPAQKQESTATPVGNNAVIVGSLHSPCLAQRCERKGTGTDTLPVYASCFAFAGSLLISLWSFRRLGKEIRTSDYWKLEWASGQMLTDAFPFPRSRSCCLQTFPALYSLMVAGKLPKCTSTSPLSYPLSL